MWNDYRFIPERRAWDAEECELIARAIGLYDVFPDSAFSDERWLKELTREFCRTRRLSITIAPAINEWPLNRSAKRWLIDAKEPPIPGRGQDYRWELELASGELLDAKLDQVRVTRWFVNNPNGEDETIQTEMLEDLLEEAKTWQEAAQILMEWFYDRKAAEDPYFR